MSCRCWSSRPSRRAARRWPPRWSPSRDAQTLAGQFAALADPVRLRLVPLPAAAGGPICACDLVEPAGRSQGTVSWHLGKLREVGILVSEKRGRDVWYAVNPSALEALRSALATG